MFPSSQVHGNYLQNRTETGNARQPFAVLMHSRIRTHVSSSLSHASVVPERRWAATHFVPAGPLHQVAQFQTFRASYMGAVICLECAQPF